MGKNFQTFLAVVGVEEEDSGVVNSPNDLINLSHLKLNKRLSQHDCLPSQGYIASRQFPAHPPFCKIAALACFEIWNTPFSRGKSLNCIVSGIELSIVP